MKRPKGKEAFLEYYRNLFANDREFGQFIENISEKKLPVLRFESRQENNLRKVWSEAGFEWKVVPWYPLALEWPEGVPRGTVLPGYEERLFYPMSVSSLVPVLALELEADDLVLDACAAPGGKALMIGEILGDESSLVANDLSFKRGMRMKRVFDEYGKRDIQVIVGAAEKLSRRYPERFDKILLDAPCSSEHHVFSSPEHLSRWSHLRIEKLQRRQIKLITSLVGALKPGGRLVYATCAVTPEENEQVIATVMKNNNLGIKPVSLSHLSLDERFSLNKTGDQIRSGLWTDPVFVAGFEKVN